VVVNDRDVDLMPPVVVNVSRGSRQGVTLRIEGTG
jgi:hypothetical protein